MFKTPLDINADLLKFYATTLCCNNTHHTYLRYALK